MDAPTVVGLGDVHLPYEKLTVTLDLVIRDERGVETGRLHRPADITLLQLAQFTQAALMGVVSGLSFKDTAGTSHAQTAAVTAGTPQIAFGIGSTAAAFTDFKIQTTAGASSDVIAATVTAIASNTFTVTATWTNTTAGTISISELAMYVTTTAGMASNSTFALSHDVFTGQGVSANGTAAATLTFTWG